MGKREREKGARGERAVAKMFRGEGWTEAERELDQYQKPLGRDLKGTKPYCVQVKNSKTASMVSALLEAEEAADIDYNWPVAFVNRNGRWMVAMFANTFFDLASFDNDFFGEERKE